MLIKQNTPNTPHLYRADRYKNQSVCKKSVIPQPDKHCHHHHAHRCCSSQHRWRAGIPFYVLFFDLVICTAIPPQKVAFRSSIHISNMFSPPAVSLVCLGDRLIKKRIGIPPWLSAHPPSAHEEMPEAGALRTTGNNGSRYANAHPRTGCRIHGTSADMRSLCHRRAVPCVPSRCGHVPAYLRSKNSYIPLLYLSSVERWRTPILAHFLRFML